MSSIPFILLVFLIKPSTIELKSGKLLGLLIPTDIVASEDLAIKFHRLYEIHSIACRHFEAASFVSFLLYLSSAAINGVFESEYSTITPRSSNESAGINLYTIAFSFTLF